MAREDREIDTTYLSLDKAEDRRLIHRDYIAHCLRWTHMLKVLQRTYADAVVIDVGCGKEAPMARALYTARMTPLKYFGVDYGKIYPIESMLKRDNYEFIENTEFETVCGEIYDAIELEGLDEKRIYFVSFEVLEHMTPSKCRNTIEFISQGLEMFPNSCAYISTPCWNGKAAANHINEITYTALGAMFERYSLEIVEHFGTFASQSEYKKHMSAAELVLFEGLSKYYDSNLVSNIFAPLFPQYSRNVIWHLTHNAEVFDNQFMELESQKGPWTSSADWKDLKL